MASQTITTFTNNPRLRVPLLLIGVMLLTFALERVVIWAALRERFAEATASQLIKAFLVGLRFDLVIACTLVIPFVSLLSVISAQGLTRRRFGQFTSGAAAVVLALVAFSCVADFFFFCEFDERLNHKALNYLGYRYTYQVIWRDFPVVPALLGTAAVMAVVYQLFRRVGFPRGERGDWSWMSRAGWVAAQVVLIIAAIRGSFGPKPLNAGPAYFSNSPTVAQLTLNNLYTLREAAFSLTFRAEELAEHLPVLPQAEALNLATKLIVRPDDQLLGDEDNPLRRITETGRPRADYNVVLVVLESLSWHYIGAMEGDARLTPNLNALAAEGLLFDHCFAVGDRTTRGFSGIVGGFPDLPGRSVTTRYESTGQFLTFGQLLARRGYETIFLYGGQPMYDHRQSFLGSNGYARMVFEDQFPTKTFRTELGWCDEDLFNAAHAAFSAAPTDRPFMATLLTLSFHRPFLIPPGRVAPVEPAHTFALELDAIRYTDWCIGQFMAKARGSSYFDRTMFVFVADHPGGFAEHPLNPAAYRVPFLIYAPKILAERGIPQPQRISAICSQTDVVPTIMALLGGRYQHCFFGSSVLDRPADAGFALIQRSSGELTLLASNGELVLIPFGADAHFFRYAAPNKLFTPKGRPGAAATRKAELTRRAVALLQAASVIYQRGAHRLRGALPTPALTP